MHTHSKNQTIESHPLLAPVVSENRPLHRTGRVVGCLNLIKKKPFAFAITGFLGFAMVMSIVEADIHLGLTPAKEKYEQWSNDLNAWFQILVILCVGLPCFCLFGLFGAALSQCRRQSDNSDFENGTHPMVDRQQSRHLFHRSSTPHTVTNISFSAQRYENEGTLKATLVEADCLAVEQCYEQDPTTALIYFKNVKSTVMKASEAKKLNENCAPVFVNDHFVKLTAAEIILQTECKLNSRYQQALSHPYQQGGRTAGNNGFNHIYQAVSGQFENEAAELRL